MAQAYLETTVWADTAGVNHTYLLEGDRMIAYIRHGTAEPFYFSKPITISRSGRKFKLVEPNPFDATVFPVEQDADVREIAGSNGAVYLLNVRDRTCTCPGYTFRGTCKHIKELDD